jgi:diketogulonate reductase-like aldo/keto reductase
MIKKVFDSVKLNHGIEIPWLGFSVFQIEDGVQANEDVHLLGVRSV